MKGIFRSRSVAALTVIIGATLVAGMLSRRELAGTNEKSSEPEGTSTPEPPKVHSTSLDQGTSRRTSRNILILSLVLLAFGLWTVHLIRPYSSDDVAQQVAISNISSGSHPTIHLPSDNFVYKLPIYFIVGLIHADSRTLLFITTLLLNGVGFVVFFLSLRYFLRAFSIWRNSNLVTLVWLASLGLSLLTSLVNPNTRNLEIGLMFGLLALMHRYYQGGFELRATRSRVVVTGLTILAGLIVYSDPFLVFMLAAPVLLMLGLRLVDDHRDFQAWRLAGFVTTILLVSKLWNLVMSALGIQSASTGVAFAGAGQVGRNLGLLVEGLPNLFGANIFGQSVMSAAGIDAMLNLALLGGALLSPLLLLRSDVRRDMWKVFFVLQPPFVLAIFIFSGMVVDALSIRYLVTLPFYAAFIWAVFWLPAVAPRRRVALIALISGVVVLNVFTLAGQYRTRGDNPNAANYELIQAAASRGLTKGYAPYWSSAINTYLSDNKIAFIQSGCGRELGIRPYYWLMNEQILKRPAARSFYLLQPSTTRCTEDNVKTFLGEPAEIVDVGMSGKLFVYNRDITSSIVRH